jgi:Family of unknown function (DUF6228)
VNGDDLDMTAAPQVTVRSGKDPNVRVLLHDCQFVDQDETAFAVSLQASGLTAHYRDVTVNAWDPEYLYQFLDGLAADFRGWDGTRSWAVGHLKVCATFHSRGHVELRWTLRPRVTMQDSWEASVTTWLEAGQQMTGLAADVRDFLARNLC